MSIDAAIVRQLFEGLERLAADLESERERARGLETRVQALEREAGPRAGDRIDMPRARAVLRSPPFRPRPPLGFGTSGSKTATAASISRTVAGTCSPGVPWDHLKHEQPAEWRRAARTEAPRSEWIEGRPDWMRGSRR